MTPRALEHIAQSAHLNVQHDLRTLMPIADLFEGASLDRLGMSSRHKMFITGNGTQFLRLSEQFALTLIQVKLTSLPACTRMSKRHMTSKRLSATKYEQLVGLHTALRKTDSVQPRCGFWRL